ncbi:MAG: LytTR family transcriptional regulator DNA-binding domain-containing protein [Flavobacteriales bacterium]|nr:LytTR family transcriptional regulator DNA-binding domain-containing protein [Flavobacteriales bacterium]
MRTLIIDDERLARKELAGLLKNFPEIEVLAECTNAEEAIEVISNLKPDLIFLDVQMPGMNGFEMLEELDFVPRVIFVTAFDEFALKAFEVNALDYLLKPVEEDRLADAIQKVSASRSSLNTQPRSAEMLSSSKLGQADQIFLKDGEKCWFVTLNDIRLFESEGNYVRVFFANSKPLILKSLNNLEEKLDNTFFRANRKHIVNLRWVQSVENWFNGGLRLTLKDNTQIEVSRRQSAKFKDLMSL